MKQQVLEMDFYNPLDSCIMFFEIRDFLRQEDTSTQATQFSPLKTHHFWGMYHQVYS